MLSIKPEVNDALHCREIKTESRPQKYGTVKFRRVVFQIRERTDRQSDIHSNIYINAGGNTLHASQRGRRNNSTYPWRRSMTYKLTTFRYTSSTSQPRIRLWDFPAPVMRYRQRARWLEQLQQRRIHGSTSARHIYRYQRHAAARLSQLSCKYNESTILLCTNRSVPFMP